MIIMIDPQVTIRLKIKNHIYLPILISLPRANVGSLNEKIQKGLFENN